MRGPTPMAWSLALHLASETASPWQERPCTDGGPTHPLRNPRGLAVMDEKAYTRSHGLGVYLTHEGALP
ncbi:hypothetical protein NDU88_000440 [Pleurodeles waltl]|uniref:Uncharacterized protein n=1 Tax=Pleurodeles waltl TaxID=8319 RepID=A0AAV7U750_PLEWA|nr:hypothetical protein NDU88_000440 [Pleurodeles waltl]